MRPTTIFATALAVTLSCGVLFAATKKYKLKNDVTRTSVAGKTSLGARALLLPPNPDYHGVFAITMWAPKDLEHACKVEMTSRNVNSFTTKRQRYEDIVAGKDTCKENAKNKKELSFTGQQTYVRGVNVCLKGERVAGVRVYGTRLNRSTGRLSKLSDTKEWTVDGCTNWKTAQFCPTGKIATALEVEHTLTDVDTSPTAEMVGLRLQCRSLVQKK